jgi:hypothetical protein
VKKTGFFEKSEKTLVFPILVAKPQKLPSRPEKTQKNPKKPEKTVSTKSTAPSRNPPQFAERPLLDPIVTVQSPMSWKFEPKNPATSGFSLDSHGKQ